MTGQLWLAGTFAAVMLMTAAYCLTRLAVSIRQHRLTDRPADAVHALMGIAMGGMLMPGLRLPWAGGWELLFGAGAAMFAGRVIAGRRSRAGAASGTGHRASHDIQHLIGCSAMVYMLALAGRTAAGLADRPGAMSGGPAPGAAVALILAAALLGYVAWTADRLSSMPPVTVLAAAAGRGGGGERAGGQGGDGPAGIAAGRDGRPRTPRSALAPAVRLL